MESRRAKKREQPSEAWPVVVARKPRHLHKWALGKPILLAISAHVAVTSVPAVVELAKLMSTGEVRAKAATRLPGPEAWLSMYQTPDSVLNSLRATFFPWRPGGEVMSFLAEGLLRGATDPLASHQAKRRVQNRTISEIIAHRQAIEHGLRYQYQQHLAAIERSLSGIAEETAQDLDEMFAKPSSLFAILILLPCAMLYGESAWELYGRATKGDLVALDQLLRVDKRVLLDERIRGLIDHQVVEGSEQSRRVIADPFAEEADYDLKLRRVTDLTAGLISLEADRMGVKLWPEDVYELFNAAHRDRTGKEHEPDPVWPREPDARRQMIHRGKQFMEKLLPRDKESNRLRHVETDFLAVVSDVDEESSRPTWLDQPKPAATAGPGPGRGFAVLSKIARWTLDHFMSRRRRSL